MQGDFIALTCLGTNFMVEVMQYYGLVVYWARRAHERLAVVGVRIDFETLVQEGSVGLVEAANRYDPQAGAQFATFASPRIRGAIEDYLRSSDLLPQKRRQAVQRLNQARERLAQRLGREPSREELAGELGEPVEEISDLELLSRLRVEELDWEELDQLPHFPQEPGNQESLSAEVGECLEGALDEDERQLLLLRFWEAMTLQKAGELMGRPVQTLHNMEMRARLKMKKCLERKGVKGISDAGI